MLITTVLGIVVAVNIILELYVPKIYNEGIFFFFFKEIHNRNLFQMCLIFLLLSNSLDFLSILLDILVEKYVSICELLFKGYLLSKASLNSSKKH